MSVRISIDLPEGALASLRVTPAELVPKLLLAAAAKWYEIGRISQSRAAEIAGLSREEFLNALGEFGVSPFQLTTEELAADASP